jgi:hypothetical protein
MGLAASEQARGAFRMFEIQRPTSVAKPRLKNGAKPFGALLAAAALLLGLAAPANAESQTVKGTGDITKMSVSNGQNAVVAKVFTDGGKCSVTKEVWIDLRDGDGTKYKAWGGCIPGDPASGGGWHKALERGGKGVACGGFTLAYDKAGGFWRFEVPRSCLAGLAKLVKVSAVHSSFVTATVNEAGPTRWLSRG